MTRQDWIDWALLSTSTIWFCAFVFGHWAVLGGVAISGLELWRLRRAARREQ